MTKNKVKIKNILITLLFLFIAHLCRSPLFHFSVVPYLGSACGLLRPLIFIGFCTAWSISLYRTINNNKLRILLQSLAIFCILLLTFRTIKYELTERGDALNIFLQYAYYLPTLMMPTLGFFVSLYARRGERYVIPTYLSMPVFGISVAALLFIFTNPLHELFWKHTPAPYSHAIGYYIVVGWIALLIAAAILNIVILSKIPGKRAAAKLPLLVIGAIIVYYLLLAFVPPLYNWILDWTSFNCLAAITLMQACISSGMLPSNRGYAQVFEVTDKGMIITDDDWEVCYASAGAEFFPKETLQKTEKETIAIRKDTLLKGSVLHPGHLVWKEDISAISAILEELEQNRKELTAKNELDRENNRTELELSRVQEKNRLYDVSQAATSGQNRRLRETLARYFRETDEAAKKALLAQASVLGAYIKRKGNLIFAGDGGTVKASELKLCFNESLANLELLPCDCHMDFLLPDDAELTMDQALMLYDCFELAVEAVLPDVDIVYLRIPEEESNLRAIYRLVSPCDLSAVVFPEAAHVVKDADTWIVSLTLPKGGAVR